MFRSGQKYIVFVVVLCLIFNLIPVLAQPDLQKPISIDAQNKTLAEVLEQISIAGGINFSYSPSEIISERRISLSVKDVPVSEILDSLCTELNLGYVIVEEQIVLKAAGKNEQDTSGYRKELFSLSGYVYDRKTGEVLIGANILIDELAAGVVTNPFGFYSITLPRGLYILKLSYVGFKKSIIPVILDTNIVRDFHLDQEISSLQEVIIRDDYEGEVSGRTQMSQLKLEPTSVSIMPALLGEPDVIKSLQSVPGINLMGDGSTLFFVRGGNKDQNLILLDDAPIYMPSHMLGFFSTIVPDAVKEIKIFKGDMPAEYGGRLSSLIDIRSKDGNMNQWGVSGSFGLVSVKGTVEGPVVKGRSSLFLSGRRSYFGWFVDQFVPDLNKMNFSDLTGKFNFRINDNNRLYFSGYAGRDYFSEGPSGSDLSGIRWQNLTGSFRWNHLFSDKLFSNTTVYASKYDYSLVTDLDRNDVWHARIANISSKTDFTWYRNPDNTIRVGGLFSYHSFNPGNYESGTDTKAVDFPIVSMKYATETALYFSDSRNIFNWLSIRYGARVNLWMNSGKSTEYSFNENYQVTDTSFYKSAEVYNFFVTLEPRIGVSFWINPATSIRAGYSTTVQHIHLITNSISPFTTVEVWLPSGPNIKPEIADIITAGFFRRLHYPEMEFSIEAFYKHMRNQIDYTDHAQMLLNPLVESELRFGSAESAGLEILLKKNYGRLTGWLGYTFSHATRKISGINNNKPYPASWDRPNDLSLFVAYDISKRINISANWIYMTGSAFSSPVSFYYYNGRSIPLYAEKNNDRLPDYHRFDVSARFDLNKNDEKFDHNLVLSIWNIYNRKNPIAINFNKIKTEEGDIVVPTNFIKQPLLYSTQLYLFGIMPSITYNFRF
jgi:outer membrane cobalamin receptor